MYIYISSFHDIDIYVCICSVHDVRDCCVAFAFVTSLAFIVFSVATQRTHSIVPIKKTIRYYESTRTSYYPPALYNAAKDIFGPEEERHRRMLAMGSLPITPQGENS